MAHLIPIGRAQLLQTAAVRLDVGNVDGKAADVFRGAAAPRAASMGVTRGAGTGMGERVTSRVTTTDFERAPDPHVVVTIRYDTTAALIEAGIMPSTTGPCAFPADVKSDPSFCQELAG